MTTFKVEDPNIGDYICVYLKDSGWIQLKIESEGVVVDAFDMSDSEPFFTTCLWNEDLEAGANEEAEYLAELERGYAQDRI